VYILQNVFDIQQGVSIGFFTKDEEVNSKSIIYQSNIWGKRDTKYQKLQF
jgi:hypothetical protein